MNITKTLQCPFTWDIDEVLISQYDEKNELEVTVHTQPVMSFMKSVMITYANMEQENYEGAESNLQKTEKIWNQINKFKQKQITKDKISLRVLLHIKKATKYFVLEKINKPIANKILNNITNSTEFKNEIEIATVEGCKSIVWLNFHQHAFEKAMVHAKLAYAKMPDCSLWNFILAKTLRFSRRYDNFSKEITNEEKYHLIQSYDLLKIPYYAINVAEMYRDLGQTDIAKKLCTDIFGNQPKDLGILLRLTKLFISFKNFQKAKVCLDRLEKSIPQDSAFLHYKGLYFEKQGKCKEAVRYLKKVITRSNKNYVAEKTYLRCMIKIHQANFNHLNYLKKMAIKYDGSTRQIILLDIGLYYYFRKKDVCSAAFYLWQSIKMNPEKKCYLNYYNYHKKKCINVFDFIKNILLQKFEERKPRWSRSESIFKDLIVFCVQQ